MWARRREGPAAEGAERDQAPTGPLTARNPNAAPAAGETGDEGEHGQIEVRESLPQEAKRREPGRHVPRRGGQPEEKSKPESASGQGGRPAELRGGARRFEAERQEG